MKKSFKITFLTLFLFQIFFFFNTTFVNSMYTNDIENIRLVLDTLNKEELPSNFRKSNDNIELSKNNLNFSPQNYLYVNLDGLKTLNISGSKQFSQNGLNMIKNSIGQETPITVVDLRQEFHGFINGIAVSWENEKNNANATKNLTIDQLLSEEDTMLKSIILNKPITLYNLPSITVVPGVVKNEFNMCDSFSIEYLRIPVTDGKLPTDNVIDSFLSYVKTKNPNTWLHFHCKAGIGRTTTFMIMYDMIKNAKNVNINDIIKRQLLLAKFDEKDINSFNSKERIEFLDKFYNYCKTNNDNFLTSWSQWIKSYYIKN